MRHVSTQRLISFFEILLTLLLAWIVSQTLWQFLAPDPTIVSDNPAQLARSIDNSSDAGLNTEILSSFDPFNRTANVPSAPTKAALAPQTKLDLKLLGVRKNLSGANSGSAIIRLPNSQERVFTIDDEIIRGVALHEIFATHVTLTRAGARETLYLDGIDPVQARQTGRPRQPAASTEASQTTQTITGTVTREQVLALSKSVQLTTSSGNKDEDGLLITGQDNQADLLIFGLKPGDRIVAINGTPIASTRELLAALNAVDNSRLLTLRLKRDGEELEFGYDFQAK